MQGFHIARPMPLTFLHSWVDEADTPASSLRRVPNQATADRPTTWTSPRKASA